MWGENMFLLVMQILICLALFCAIISIKSAYDRYLEHDIKWFYRFSLNDIPKLQQIACSAVVLLGIGFCFNIYQIGEVVHIINANLSDEMYEVIMKQNSELRESVKSIEEKDDGSQEYKNLKLITGFMVDEVNREYKRNKEYLNDSIISKLSYGLISPAYKDIEIIDNFSDYNREESLKLFID